MYKSRNFKVDTDVRLRILEQQLKAQTDELSAMKTKLTVTEEKLAKQNALEQLLKAQMDELKEVKAKLISLEEKQLRQSAHEAQLKSLTETVNELNTKLTSAQVSAPELAGGMTPEEAVQEIYRMCGLGDDK